MKISIGQIWWDWSGHVSGCNPRFVYVVLGKDADDYWVCSCVHYLGMVDAQFMGGRDNKRLTDKELNGMRHLGSLPTRELERSIGPYKDYMLDREWVAKEYKAK